MAIAHPIQNEKREMREVPPQMQPGLSAYGMTIQGSRSEENYMRTAAVIREDILGTASALRGGLTREQRDAMYWAAQELLVNAYKHGNGGDPRKRVGISLYDLPERLFVLRVSDQGNGFDINKIPRPSEMEFPAVPEDPELLNAALEELCAQLETSGRGLRVLQAHDPVAFVRSHDGIGRVDVYFNF